ncbi:lysostaphin resistance A-like protein [Salinivirga cyanobacteriivorans]
MEKAKSYYPSVAQSWGIVGIAIVSMLLFMPLNSALTGVFGKEISFFVYYLFSMGVPFVLAHFLRKKETGVTEYNFGSGSTKVMVFMIITTIAIQTGIIVPIVSLVPMPEFMQEIFREFAQQDGLFSFISIVIAAPVIEELIFRGIILDGLLKRYSPVKSIILSSVLFGIVHLNPWQFIGALIVGVFSGWVYYKTRKLTFSILIHAANNLFAFAPVYFMSPETMMSESLTDLYGSSLNVFFITGGAIIISILGLLMLKKEFSN